VEARRVWCSGRQYCLLEDNSHGVLVVMELSPLPGQGKYGTEGEQQVPFTWGEVACALVEEDGQGTSAGGRYEDPREFRKDRERSLDPALFIETGGVNQFRETGFQKTARLGRAGRYRAHVFYSAPGTGISGEVSSS
jgi:hypothetical protein